MTEERYNFQCPMGHAGVAPTGSDLEQRCIQHATAGYLDALGVSPEECPHCIEATQNDTDRQQAVGMSGFYLL